MGEDAPLVTITVCVRNGADWVEGCMQSLLEQTWRPLEIVAVDDGSSDGSDERLQAFHDPDGEVPVRVLRRPAEGLAAAETLLLEQQEEPGSPSQTSTFGPCRTGLKH